MSLTVSRFLVGGVLVSGIPLAAKHAGPFLAGLIVLVPATSALAIYFVGHVEGATAVTQITHGGLSGLLPLAIFLVTVAAAAPRASAGAAVCWGLGAWAAAVIVVQAAKPPTWVMVVAAATIVLGAMTKARKLRIPGEAFRDEAAMRAMERDPTQGRNDGFDPAGPQQEDRNGA